jgi:hypothetical protein
MCARVNKTEITRGLLDLMATAFSLMKQLHPEANQLMMYATEDGACVQGYREAPSWAKRLILDGFKSPNGDYQIRDLSE